MHHHPNHGRGRLRARATGALAMAGGLVAASLAVVAPPADAAIAYLVTTGRVSVPAPGAPGPAGAERGLVAVSGDGRFVAFTSASPLVAADTNGVSDVYVRDRMAGTTTRASLGPSGQQLSALSEVCSLSRDGRYVGFTSGGADALDTPLDQVYLRDRWSGTTEMVSVSTNGDPSSSSAGGTGIGSDRCPVSDDGRYVAFSSQGDNLAGGDGNGTGWDVFRRDRKTASTQRISVSSAGFGANAVSRAPAMSANGAVVAFESSATNLVPGDSNAKPDVFVREPAASLTTRISVTAGGSQLGAASGSPALSADGNEVAFVSSATNLVAGDTNGVDDVFVRDRAASTVARASKGLDGQQIDGQARNPDISGDGSVVSWSMFRGWVVPGDANQDDDVYRYRLGDPSSALVSVDRTGVAGDGESYFHALSNDGLVVAFVSTASDLVRNDDAASDAFARDFQSLLSPFISETAFVRQQFVDFEGRQPTAAELAEWRARIQHGERTPDEVIDELAHGSTWAAKRAPLTRLYWAFFLRPPDTGGMTYWTNQLTKGKKLAEVARQFAGSSEFTTKYGALANSAFVTKIYQNIFSRNPDPGGLAYWTGKLDKKQKTRGDVMVSFSESSEGKRKLAPQTDTVLIYLGMLRKMPTLAITLEGIAAIRDQGYPAEIVAESLREQADYAARVVQS
ncbi:MAG TPA: DUF4214 domain-containing protein [Aquihabitans sp.]|nr:DUF4214 domain-containing protein [Aquihabitans sp.]